MPSTLDPGLLDTDQDLAPFLPPCLPRHADLYIGGRWQPPQAGDHAVSLSPATQALLGHYAIASEADVDAAVQAARRAQPAWAALAPLERAAALRRAAALVREHALELALLDAADCGNPVRELLGDAQYAAAQLEYFAGLVLELKGQTHPTANGSLDYTLHEPLGVVARIFPFNHPFMFAAAKIAAPLAAGNAVVIKPPEQAPLSTLRLMELLDGVFPPGVLNAISGDRQTGALLAAHPGVDAVGLIGSVPAGKAVMRAGADTLKKLLLELGGKNAMAVLPDADMALAVDGAARGMNFGWAGQSCGSTSRLFLHDAVHDEFVDRLGARIQALYRPGLPTHTRTSMGALVSREQLQRSMDHIGAARQEGARLVCGGSRPQEPELAAGWFLQPTVFAGVQPHMRLAREEVFGPVLAVLRWRDEDELVAAINGVDYGLTASIWTENLRSAHRLARRVQAGYVWVNGCSQHFLGTPFGGYKQSGLGREECKQELLDFTQVKNINVAA